MQKEQVEKNIKLHLGCGKKIIPGYVNIDIQPAPGVDVVCDIRNLPYEDNSIDFIYSCANLEHFGRKEWQGVLAHWYSKLQPGGTLRISTNNFKASAERYAQTGNLDELLGLLIGGQKDDYDWHGMIFDFEILKTGLEAAGFSNVREYDWRQTDIGDMNFDDYSQAYLPHMDKQKGQLMVLNVEADKPRVALQTVVRAAYYTRDPSWRNNNMFDVASNISSHNNEVAIHARLKSFLKDKGIDLNTHDLYQNQDKADFWIVADPDWNFFKTAFKKRLRLSKSILFISEPSVTNPKWSKLFSSYSKLFGSVLTWNPEIASRGKNYVRYYFPTIFDQSLYNNYKNMVKINLCLMVHSNKVSGVKGQLYSLRRDIIRYFEKRGDGLFDLYGYGWNTSRNVQPFFTKLYKGTTPSKMQTFAQHAFVFCIDNSIVPGYITYDPFLAMAAGSVPIYMPMPDSHYYIPSDTYINFNDFKDNLDGLVDYLQEFVKDGRWEICRQKGWEFINSEAFYPFTVKNFCESVYHAISLTVV